MAQQLSPGVVVEEVQGKNGQVPLASTSAFAIAGYSPRGPEGKAYIHGSFAEFTARFGSFNRKSLNAYQAAAYFLNGGARFIFVRAMHSDATYASGSFASASGIAYDVKASGRGVWANDGVVTISGNESFYDRPSGQYQRFDVAIQLINPDTGLLELSESYDAVILNDDQDPDYVVEVIKEASEDISLTAIDGGVPVVLQPVLNPGQALGTGDGSTNTFSATYGSSVPLGEGAVIVKANGVEIAIDDGNGNMIAVDGGPVISGTVDYATGAVSVNINPAPISGVVLTTDVLKKPAASLSTTLLGGLDGSAVIASDVTSAALKTSKAGIYALDDIQEQFALDLPDYAGDKDTDLAKVSYAEGRTTVVALLTPPKGHSPQQAVDYRRNKVKTQSSFAAWYYPWIAVPDPINKNRNKLIPLGGHIAGRYAFTDLTENVGKAPAGQIRGALQFFNELERTLSKTDWDTLYQAQINYIRSDASVGTAIWGNKTSQAVGDFTEVNVRRLFIFLRQSLESGLNDKLFEDVGPVTWGVIKARIEQFLENLWLNNVIGSGAADKTSVFKVVVDSSNNPPSVQQARKIIVDVFVKPNIAAEFILIRLQRVFDASQI